MPKTTTAGAKISVEDVKDLVRDALESDPEVFSADDDEDGNIVVECIDADESRFKVTVVKL